MKISTRYILVCGLLSMAASVSAQQKECSKIVISADSDYAPLHWYDGKKLTGASIEITAGALQALNIPFEVRYMGPFHRVLDGAKTGEIDMISSLKETPERREYLAFASVPLFTNPIAVFVSKNRVFPYTGWSDLIGKKGGITRGNQFGNGFDEFLAKNLSIESEQKAYMNFKKIELGRIDYLITGYYTGLTYLVQSGQADKFIALKPYIAESENLIAISKLSPCLKYLKPLNTQLERMRQKGELKAILDKHVALIKAER
jgi:polar amino acid transport system substrate-binding protein